MEPIEDGPNDLDGSGHENLYGRLVPTITEWHIERIRLRNERIKHWNKLESEGKPIPKDWGDDFSFLEDHHNINTIFPKKWPIKYHESRIHPSLDPDKNAWGMNK